MRTLRLLAPLIAGAAVAAARDPQSDSAARINALLAPRITTHEANGTVLVFRNGLQVYRRDIGMADFERRRPIDRRTRFRLASVSKTFTGGLATILRSEDRVKFPATVADYLPGFPRGKKIKVYYLLVHSSGLGDVRDPAPGQPYRSISAAVASFEQSALAFPPGSRSQYSNAGYVLMARILEVASGQPYDSLLQRRLFDPLSMRSAGESLAAAPRPDDARLYFPGAGLNNVVSAERADLSSVVGAGALEMTSDDLMRWLEAVRTSRLFDIWNQEFPWGWGSRDYFGGKAIEQSGRNAGYTTSVLIVPDRKLSVLCLFNTQSGFGLHCASAVAAAFLDQPSPTKALPLDFPRAPLNARTASAIAGTYVGNGWTLRVSRRDGGLRYSWSGERWLPLTPSTEHRFLMLSDSAMVTVAPDQRGQIDRLRYMDGSVDVTLVRKA